ncbi:MAG TPA: LysE family translocator [Solirubrobacteraceae bacterium]
MPDLSTFALFAATSLVILVVPGPAVLFIVTRSLEHGRTAGLVSMLGVETGGLVHVAFATAGLSALLASSSAAFNVVRYAGAAYLIWLGLTRLLRRHEFEPTAGRPPRTSYARIFRQGVIVNVLNPKVTIFFLAFLPQFGAGPLELLVLGLIYTVIAVLSDGAYALLAGSLGDRLRRRPRVRARIERGSGVVYMLLGGAAAVEH